MYFNTLPERPQSRQKIDVFGGYNHNLRIPENEFYDMLNMSSTYYPMLSQRPERGVLTVASKINGITATDKLWWVEGESLVSEDDSVDLDLTDGEKTLVVMGAYIIVLPDKKYLNTANTEDKGSIEETFTGRIEYSICDISGEGFEITSVGSAPPDVPEQEPTDGLYWMDVTETPHTLKRYNYYSKEWIAVITYLKLTADLPFSAYDGVAVAESYVLGSNVVVLAKGDGYAIIPMPPTYRGESSEENVSLSRTMPEMDFVIESGNRLWGCRYDGSVNEIYASKLGDFKNWNCYQGISTDSYTASVGTAGKFTGAITHLNHPIFFKEDCMHKIYGAMPSEFAIQTTPCRGVQDGSHKSLAIVNEILYYKSKNGVCAYDGSLPVEVSAALGNERYFEAVGGGFGDKYYLSMLGDKGYTLFAYDTAKGLWHKEDNLKVLAFTSLKQEIYFVAEKEHPEGDTMYIGTIFGSGEGEKEGAIYWMVESGIIGFDTDDRKYVSGIDIRMALEFKSVVYVAIEYDSSGEWDTVYTSRDVKLKSFNIPIRPSRCDHFRIRISGRGCAKIYSITKTIEEGSNL